MSAFDPLAHPQPETYPAPSKVRVSAHRFSWAQEKGRSLNEQLIQAAWDDDLHLVKSLVQQGADINYQDREMESCHLIATSEGYLGLLDFTLRHGAQLTRYDQYGGNGMIRAAERGHGEACAMLYHAGDQVDRVNKLGYTALTEAIIFGAGCVRYVQTVLLLLAAGADPGFMVQGRSIIRLAQEHGFSALEAMLKRAKEAPGMSQAQAKDYLQSSYEKGDACGAALALRQHPSLFAQDLPGAPGKAQPAVEAQRRLIRWLMGMMNPASDKKMGSACSPPANGI